MMNVLQIHNHTYCLVCHRVFPNQLFACHEKKSHNTREEGEKKRLRPYKHHQHESPACISASAN